jgi:hypothetical protein
VIKFYSGTAGVLHHRGLREQSSWSFKGGSIITFKILLLVVYTRFQPKGSVVTLLKNRMKTREENER